MENKRAYLSDLSFVEWSLVEIKPDRWRPHGVRYHVHIDGVEKHYAFESFAKLKEDFDREVRKLGGPL